MDSVVPRCPYSSVRRSNPTCGASKTMFQRQEASPLSWTRRSLGWMSESKASYVRLVNRNWRKRLTRQNQKVHGQDRAVPLRTTILNNARRVTDDIPFRTFESSLDQQGKPYASHVSGIRTARNGDDAGGKRSRKKRKPRCNGVDRAVKTGMPNSKGCRLPAGLPRT
jgi:hypothetical protein